MRALLTSLLLGLPVFAASADCLDVAAPQVARVAQRGELVRPAAAAGAPNASQAREGAFIRTRNQVAAREADEKADGKRGDHRGSIMLLAALAIMSAIALRHAAASSR